MLIESSYRSAGKMQLNSNKSLCHIEAVELRKNLSGRPFLLNELVFGAAITACYKAQEQLERI